MGTGTQLSGVLAANSPNLTANPSVELWPCQADGIHWCNDGML